MYLNFPLRSVMQSLSSALCDFLDSVCILILLTTTFSTVSVSAVPTVMVNLHGSATLPCSERCSDSVKWVMSNNPTEVLAECDQTSCRSVKEGYQMIHDQYLKGNLSLTITDADFTKRGWYTCHCDGKDINDVQLLIEASSTAVQIEPGESLVLDLYTSGPVKVIYNGTSAAGPSSCQICTVDGRSLQCEPEYKQRASLTSAFELRGMTPSDTGVYVIQDTKNNKIIHKYTVTVKGDHPDLDTDRGAAVPVWVAVLMVVLVAMIVVLVIVQLGRKNQQLRMNNERTVVQMNGHGNHSPENERLSPLNNTVEV